MENILVIPRIQASQCMAEITRLAGGAIMLPVSVIQNAEQRLFLAAPGDSQAPGFIQTQLHPYFRVTAAQSPPPDWPLTVWPTACLGQLWIGRNAAQGQMTGLVRINDALEPLNCAHLPGAGMFKFRLGHTFAETTAAPEMHSRTIGALGGNAIWRRLIELKIVLIGCGRTGSLMADSLVRMGASHLTLVDPDIIESHNLSEMALLTKADCGKPKAEALVEILRTISDSSASLRAINSQIKSPQGLKACQAADVLVCCADNDSARLMAGIVTTLHHKVLLDVGTGIQFGPAPRGEPVPASTARSSRQMGIDVRLIIPGDGCLLCRGNLSQYARAFEGVLTSPAPTVANDWRLERAGSLRAINEIGAGLALQMLQDLVGERLRTSTWARAECDEHGRFTINYPDSSMNAPGCLLCRKAGQGASAFLW